MEPIKLAALRDFAIEHFPRAQKLRKDIISNEQYNYTLYGFCVLISPTAPASEQTAACLLRAVMSLSIKWDDEHKMSGSQRHQVEIEAIQTATELCSLTNVVIPWLADTLIAAPTEQLEPTPPELPIVQRLPQIELPRPGINLTTAQAAQLLHRKPQTLRGWASKDDGPIRPIKTGRVNAWPSDEVIRLMKKGWPTKRR